MNGLNILCLLLFVTLTHGHSTYKAKIPNGYNVKHPCDRNEIWGAVGHIEPGYSPTKNAFGEAFLNASKKWTTALCQADSDGDGLTNGEELGDPFCTWREGQAAPSQYKGHPGFCEPDRRKCDKCKIHENCPNQFATGCDAPGQSRGHGSVHRPTDINPTRPMHEPTRQNIFGTMRPQGPGSFERTDRFGSAAFGGTGGTTSFSQGHMPGQGRFGMTGRPGGFNGMGGPSVIGRPSGIGSPSGIGGPGGISRPNGMGAPSGTGVHSGFDGPSGTGVHGGFDGPIGTGGHSGFSGPSGTGGHRGFGGPSGTGGHSEFGGHGGIGGAAGMGGSRGMEGSLMSGTLGSDRAGFSAPRFPTSFSSAGSSMGRSDAFSSPRGFEGPGPSFSSGMTGFNSGSSSSSMTRPGFSPSSEGQGFPGGSGGAMTHDFGLSGTSHHQPPFTGSMTRSEIQRSVQDRMRRVGGMTPSAFPGGSTGPSHGMFGIHRGVGMVHRIPGVFMGPIRYPF